MVKKPGKNDTSVFLVGLFLRSLENKTTNAHVRCGFGEAFLVLMYLSAYILLLETAPPVN
ncbi:hypothetical protein AOX59_06820 [Lentibacillus amyloliquefaciens]|uniref:Uncharacterized protein n=1 Tax=Lentibacillus amyloliquefaciens TaxID=1472767 RepID=A0A0U4G6Q3_9BACI|nr:hypothetical protein AOX59_06820 [Lentibacillus amyloliquefaciens]